MSRRWDTHGHPLADFNGKDPESELFPGKKIKSANNNPIFLISRKY